MGGGDKSAAGLWPRNDGLVALFHVADALLQYRIAPGVSAAGHLGGAEDRSGHPSQGERRRTLRVRGARRYGRFTALFDKG
jgi:hypothetical protein